MFLIMACLLLPLPNIASQGTDGCFVRNTSPPETADTQTRQRMVQERYANQPLDKLCLKTEDLYACLPPPILFQSLTSAYEQTGEDLLSKLMALRSTSSQRLRFRPTFDARQRPVTPRSTMKGTQSQQYCVFAGMASFRWLPAALPTSNNQRTRRDLERFVATWH